MVLFSFGIYLVFVFSCVFGVYGFLGFNFVWVGVE